ncbi:MAG: biotin/lipoyl-binding protein [Pirellulaceae bacterium]|nr:biotin/lipoyl-binding protein [Pirellulaceae bacterium]
MNAVADVPVHDLMRVRPTLRRDLIFTPCAAGVPYYRVEDPVRGKFFRMGLAEYTLVSLLDGHRTLAAVVQEAARISPTDVFAEHEVAAVVRWLDEAGLLESPGLRPDADSPVVSEPPARRTRHNPLVIRVPLLHPQEWFQRLSACCGWLFHPACAVVWSMLVLTAVLSLAAQSDRLAAGGRHVFYLDRAVWLGLCWLGLKLVHETAHGIACAHYGGSVRQAGVILVLFVPLAYVDVTSSWRFSSTRPRVIVALAGMYAEIGLAAVAALGWCGTRPGTLQDLCFNVFLMAGAGTILFNANPLMRYDGYYLMSDLLGLPNLSVLGRAAVADLARQWVLGLPARGLPVTRRERWLVTAYGLAAWCWSLLVSAGLIVGAALLFHGAGIVLAVAGVVLWWGVPLVRLAGRLAGRGRLNAAQRRRGTARVTVAIASVIALLLVVPAPWVQHAPALVEYAPLTILRAPVPGHVRRVLVTSGTQVEAGQILLELENDALRQELGDLDLALAQSDLRLATLCNRGQIAAQQAELAAYESLRERRDAKRREVELLTIVAPCAAKVLTPHPEHLVGTHADEGRELLALGDEVRKELVLSIDETDIESFQASVGREVRARIAGHGRQVGVLTRVAPAASRQSPHVAFCATAGGPVPVTAPRANGESRALSAPEFLTPRFEAAVQLTAAQSRCLHAGQRATVWPATPVPTLASSVYRTLRGWWRAHARQ